MLEKQSLSSQTPAKNTTSGATQGNALPLSKDYPLATSVPVLKQEQQSGRHPPAQGEVFSKRVRLCEASSESVLLNEQRQWCQLWVRP